VKAILATAAAAFAAIPGIVAIRTGLFVPDSHSALFGGIAEAVGAICILIVWATRRSIQSMEIPTKVVICVGSVALFLGSTTAYVATTESFLLSSEMWDPKETKADESETLFPFRDTGELATFVQELGSYQAALDAHGPDAMRELIHQGDNQRSYLTCLLTCLLLYVTVFTSLAFAAAYASAMQPPTRQPETDP